MIAIDVNAERMQRTADELVRRVGQFPRVASSAITRAVTRHGKRAVRVEVTAEYAVRVADINSLMRVYPSTPKTLTATLVVQDNSSIPLAHFLRTKVAPKRRPKVGPAVRIRKTAGSVPVKGAFVIWKSGGPILLKRVGAARLPVQKLLTAAPVRHVAKPAVQARVFEAIEQGFFQEFDTYANHVLTQGRK